MKPQALLLAGLLLIGCQEKNTYITCPQDWQPPVLTWLSPPEADVRGTVGIDVSVSDTSFITTVRLYLDGVENQSVSEAPFRFEIHTDSLTDGVHLLEARAWDEFNNMGVSPILRMNVANTIVLGPHVIWVPDSFATIQAAINASTDFDTIRVRDGIYYETLNLFGKGIWMESEHGPLHCTIDDGGAFNAFSLSPGSVRATTRGFWIRGSGILVSMHLGAQHAIYNCILFGDSADGLLLASTCGGTIQNNLFIGSVTAVQLGYFWGDFQNNIIEGASDVGLWNAASSENPAIHSYNLFWNNTEHYSGFSPEIGEFIADPRIDLITGELIPGSPAIDAGNPQILDRNQTRSDIGPFGGPFAF
jgi:hypothetical protein